MAYDDLLQSLQAAPLRSLLPQPAAVMVEIAPLPTAPERFAGQQLAHHFRWEVEQRQALEDYCLWYEAIAQQNRQEMAAMARDFDLLSWFRRR
jgi:hypothetical protein